jgi:hypothetical protein
MTREFQTQRRVTSVMAAVLDNSTTPTTSFRAFTDICAMRFVGGYGWQRPSE